jgi:hypothetical protein
MKRTPLALFLTLAAVVVFAQPAQEEHSAHHPADGANAAAAAQVPAPATPTAAKVSDQMKEMQDMHVRMQAAKTPAERRALMDEHMKTMQSGMEMMRQMGGGGAPKMGAGMGGPAGGQSPQANTMGSAPMGGAESMMGMHAAMQGRMSMMEQMMQMMVDREAAAPRK